MKIKDNLNLNGYILQNFCIDNYDSLDGINDKNKGRAVFLTGNGTNAGYGHVNVYDGTSFKALAYVDDVANNEAFQELETRVKYLEGDLDVTDTINNLKDLEAFLAGFYESNGSLMDYLNTELGKKLNTSGGTIEGNLTINKFLQINAWEGYGSGTAKLWYDGNKKELQWQDIEKIKIGTNTVLHSGNVGEYAVKYDGGASIDKARHSIGYDNTGHGSANLPAPGGYISFGHDSSGGQLLGLPSGATLYYRGFSNNVFSAWKTIAFTDSDFKLGLGHSITDSNDRSALSISADNQVNIGYGTAGANFNTIIHGANIILKYGTSRSWGMVMNTSGNVTIGGNDLAETVYKLYVDGKAKIKNGLSLEGSGIYWANDVVNYSIAPTSNFEIIYTGFRGHWFKTNGIDRFRILQNGNVLIGKTTDNGKGRLQVEGDLHVSGNIIADGEVSAGGAGEEGSGSSSGGGGAFHSEGIAVGATQTTIAHGLGTDDIVVSIYEKDGVSGRWSIILTDVEIVDANNIIVSFGSATTIEHKVVIMGAVA